MSDSLAARYAHDTYLLRKKFFKLLGAAFHIYDPAGNLVLYVKQKAFKLKEDIRVYTDESLSIELLRITTQSVFDIAGTYAVIDSTTGETVGTLKRRALKSMLKDEWAILDKSGAEVGKIEEDSMLRAIVRRFIDLVTLFMSQAYNVFMNGTSVARFQQNYNIFVPKITLDFSPDRQNLLDARLGLSAAILLCAIEGRQG
jgi:uncharacterized protein YxjI